MSDNTKIEWADATVNAINGCSVTSPGCTHCYAMKQAHRFPARQGLTVQSKGGMVWTGETRLNETALLQPLKWKRPRRIFWNAHGDTFHDSVPDAWIDRVFAVAALTPQHTHMILTKRSVRMREYMTRLSAMWHDAGDTFDDRIGTLLVELSGSSCAVGMWEDEFILPNVWLGVSVEDQTRADERIPDLLATPAAVRFLSCEPLLGPVDLTRIMEASAEECFHNKDKPPFETSDGRSWTETRSSLNCLTGHYWGEDLIDGSWEGWCGEEQQPSPGFGEPGYYKPIDWAICGGESGPRPMHPDWARSLRDQCAAAGVPFHFKQWGEWLPGEIYTETIDGVTYGGLSRFPDSPAAGETYPGKQSHWWDKTDSFTPGPISVRIGKKRAGRLLDGVEHNGFPVGGEA